jgi:hypothetical protein
MRTQRPGSRWFRTTLPSFALRRVGLPVSEVIVTTLQGVSGAGYPGHASLDLIDNIVPLIRGEEEKSEQEPQKILGSARSEADRPQPKDRNAGQGMAVTVGRLRACNVFDIRFVGLSHNTVRALRVEAFSMRSCSRPTVTCSQAAAAATCRAGLVAPWLTHYCPPNTDASLWSTP